MNLKNIFKRKQPKYELGDTVRFVDYNLIGSDSVYKGLIWKIHTYWLCEPSYEVFVNMDSFSGYNYSVSESAIIEVLSKGGKSNNPFNPINKV